ncbi:MAG: hypothetical protein GC154_16525 [bacterium]|nr:hypothetical protein [bacterium]
METRIERALAWKEIRQSAPIVIAFGLLSLIIVAYLCYMHHYSTQRFKLYTLDNINNMLGVFAFFISLGLGYLMAAGNRLIESSENLEGFLFSRPVGRGSLVKVYYFVGFWGLAVWFLIFLMLCTIFFGPAIFIRTSEHNVMRYFNWEYGFFIAMLIIAHGATFCVSLAFPSLVVTAVVYCGTYFITFFLFFEARRLLTPHGVEMLFDLARYGCIAGFVAVLILGSMYYYQTKQLN